jgi:hypothetical protein
LRSRLILAVVLTALASGCPRHAPPVVVGAPLAPPPPTPPPSLLFGRWKLVIGRAESDPRNPAARSCFVDISRDPSGLGVVATAWAFGAKVRVASCAVRAGRLELTVQRDAIDAPEPEPGAEPTPAAAEERWIVSGVIPTSAPVAQFPTDETAELAPPPALLFQGDGTVRYGPTRQWPTRFTMVKSDDVTPADEEEKRAPPPARTRPTPIDVTKSDAQSEVSHRR